jgi:hypothetical protein
MEFAAHHNHHAAVQEETVVQLAQKLEVNVVSSIYFHLCHTLAPCHCIFMVHQFIVKFQEQLINAIAQLLLDTQVMSNIAVHDIFIF